MKDDIHVVEKPMSIGATPQASGEPKSTSINILPGEAVLHFAEGRINMYAPGMQEGAMMSFPETIASGLFLLVRDQHPSIQGMINEALEKAGANADGIRNKEGEGGQD